MNKQTILSFGLGVIVGAAGMWALTPEQTTFEEGVIEYAPSTPAGTATPINHMEQDGGMQNQDGSMQNQGGSNSSTETTPPTSSNEAPAATTASEAEAPAVAPSASESEAAPAPVSSLGEEESALLATNTAAQVPAPAAESNSAKEIKEECCAGKHECKEGTACTDSSHAKEKITS